MGVNIDPWVCVWFLVAITWMATVRLMVAFQGEQTRLAAGTRILAITLSLLVPFVTSTLAWYGKYTPAYGVGFAIALIVIVIVIAKTVRGHPPPTPPQ